MNARERLRLMIRDNRGNMTVWSQPEIRDAFAAYDAELLHGAAEAAAEIHQQCHREVCAGCEVRRDILDVLRSVAGVLGEKSSPAGADATSALTIYRASHDSIVMGLYTTPAAAREHCEAEERRTWLKADIPTFDWIEDEEDGVAEMTAWIGGEECTTGYTVTALEVASAYDEEADE